MNQTNNSFFSKPFIISLFWKQNGYHKHGVFIHSLRAVYYVVKNKEWKMISSALLHDIGKPFVAYQKKEDLKCGDYSFTDHEEKSYLLIKDLRFVSDYTKEIVRYHYLIRDIKKHETKEPARSLTKGQIWDKLDLQIQEDLARFMTYDDLAKK